MTAILDVFCHCLPPAFREAASRMLDRGLAMFTRACQIQVMVDLDARLRLMDSFPGYQQILSLVSPPIEALASPAKAVDLARIGNDALAEWACRFPDRFPGFIASLPMNDPDAAVAEAKRAVRSLGAVGVQIYTNVNGEPLDAPPHLDVIDSVAELGCPIWLHPTRPNTFADYRSESISKLDLWWAIGWPYETSAAMARLVAAGLFDRRPNLAVITHHAGGLIPVLEGRFDAGFDYPCHRNPREAMRIATRESLVEGLRRFWADTASFGSPIPLEAARRFFGVERMLFASDMPFDPEEGPGFIREGIRLVREMELSESQRDAIFYGNARRLFLPSPAG
jgi:aminocarboxymuconate-semialdehyde decarboxylase